MFSQEVIQGNALRKRELNRNMKCLHPYKILSNANKDRSQGKLHWQTMQ